jgi:sialic acid synthase SpsE
MDMPPLTISGHQIGPEQPTYIIAEIGINHEGDVDVCARLIEQSVKVCTGYGKSRTVLKSSLKPGRYGEHVQLC